MFGADTTFLQSSGVFVIETKTWSKRGSEPLDVKDGRILMRGRLVRGNPVGQAAGAARWLHEMLRTESGHIYECQPVVGCNVLGWHNEARFKV